MHVKNGNTYILNSTTGNFSQLTGNETVDVQASMNRQLKNMQKFGNDTDNHSENLTQSLTKYSKNVDNTTEFGNNLQNPPFIGKNMKGKKQLPSYFNEHDQSPKNITNLQKQLNKEMKKNRFIGHGVRSDVDKFQLGYETENISPANYD
jgi:hypothetical protein